MTLLALSTSTRRGSVAVLRAGTLHVARYEDLRGQAERLFGAIDEALGAIGADRAELTAIACDRGPGSFTGVRVGVASAKGIAMALGLPLIGVVSLEAMAAAAFAEGAGSEDLVASLLDAKKHEVFAAVYDRSLTPLLAPCHLPRAAVAAACAGVSAGRRLVHVGEVAAELPDLAGEILGAPDLPDAAWTARLGHARLAAGASGDAGALEPLYVRAPDAKPAPSR